MGRKSKAIEEERLAKAVRLRGARFKWDQIARHCGYSSAQTAQRAVAGYYKRREKEPLDQAVLLELELLDDMARGLMTRATHGDVRAAGTMLKIMDMRAKLLGAYPKQEVSESEQIKVVIDPRMLSAHAARQIEQEEVLEQAGEERINGE